MMVVHQHLVAASLTNTPKLEYIPWTLAAYAEPVRLSGTDVEVPDAPGASTRISPDARSRWLIPGVEGRADAS
jgi:L-alanine-DL-glutamate epimerase-like enolase superfamily enzyme